MMKSKYNIDNKTPFYQRLSVEDAMPKPVKAIIPRLQRIKTAKIKMQRMHDEFIDASAELEQEVDNLENVLREAFQ